jgi:hypothetical protein
MAVPYNAPVYCLTSIAKICEEGLSGRALGRIFAINCDYSIEVGYFPKKTLYPAQIIAGTVLRVSTTIHLSLNIK